MKRLLPILILLSLTIPLRAQVTVEEARQRMEARIAARATTNPTTMPAEVQAVIQADKERDDLLTLRMQAAPTTRPFVPAISLSNKVSDDHDYSGRTSQHRSIMDMTPNPVDPGASFENPNSATRRQNRERNRPD